MGMGKGSGKPSALKFLFYSGTVLLLLAVAIILFCTATGYLTSASSSLAFSLCFSLLLSFLVLSYLLHKGKKPRAIVKELGLSRKALSWKNAGYAVLLFIIYIGILFAIAILSRVTGITINSNVQQTIGSYPVWALLFLSIIAPLNEEIAFRAFLVPRIGVLFSGLLFAVLHFGYGSVSEIAVALWFGLAGGYVFKRTKSLYPSLMTHIAINSLTAITLVVFLHGIW
jgi:membrane protease YdiL (CAAX protease family)